MNISFLADYPEFIETLALLVAEHWRPILTQETMASRAAKFRTHLNYDTLPIAWVAHSGAQVFGTASLRVHDLPDRDNLTPWLGGVGAALCSAVEQQAKELLGISMLYLFTLDKQVWYGKLGWSMFEPCTWCGRAGDIMVKEL